MKMKWTNLLMGIVVLTMILLTGYQPVVAAPPAGEVTIVQPEFGNGIVIPYLAIPRGNDWLQMIYDQLVGTTPEGKYSTETGLANKWEMSRDGLTWTFSLRKGVKFHDGVELTTKDVKFSFDLLMRPDAVVGEAADFKKKMKNIEVKDPYTLVIYLKEPDITLLNLLSNIESYASMVVPKDYYERVGKDEFLKHPIGSGPYKFHSIRVGDFIKLEATDRHWRDGVPRFKYMTFRTIPEESSRLAMLKTGEADIARISRTVLKEAQSAGMNIITKENAGCVILKPNMQWTSPVFSDIRFRKAINLAIDKEAIIKQILAGIPKPIAMFPGANVSAFGGDPSLKPYPYDPQEARRLIKEGGWEGYEFTLISYPRTGLPEFPLIVEALAGYWQTIGLKPKISMTEYSAFRELWRNRKSQNTVHGYESTTAPDVGMLLVKFQEEWYYYHNSMRSSVNILELNDRFKRIEKSMDIAEIYRLMVEIYRYAYDNYLMIPICEIPDLIATTKKIPKWNPGLRNDRNYYEMIRQ
jgi:peptide/nickel transport system substrate-binding protein